MAAAVHPREWLALAVALVAGGVLVWGLATGEIPSRRRRFRRTENPAAFWAIGAGLAVLVVVALWVFLRAIVWKVANGI